MDHAPILLIHALATLAMTGLIWFVQLVHYPLMARVGADHFRRYEHEHTRRTTRIVAPLMFAELGSAGWILAAGAAPRGLAVAGVLLLAAIWGSTFLVQVPLHARLGRGFDARAHARLVTTNWARTAMWSARAAVALGMIASAPGS